MPKTAFVAFSFSCSIPFLSFFHSLALSLTLSFGFTLLSGERFGCKCQLPYDKGLRRSVFIRSSAVRHTAQRVLFHFRFSCFPFSVSYCLAVASIYFCCCVVCCLPVMAGSCLPINQFSSRVYLLYHLLFHRFFYQLSSLSLSTFSVFLLSFYPFTLSLLLSSYSVLRLF